MTYKLRGQTGIIIATFEDRETALFALRDALDAVTPKEAKFTLEGPEVFVGKLVGEITKK